MAYVEGQDFTIISDRKGTQNTSMALNSLIVDLSSPEFTFADYEKLKVRIQESNSNSLLMPDFKVKEALGATTSGVIYTGSRP